MFDIDEEIKHEYLDRLKGNVMERSYRLVEATLRKLDLYEQKTNKSVFEMNEVYVEDMLKDFNSSSANSLTVTFNIIKSYVFDYVANTKTMPVAFTVFDSMTMDQVASCVSKDKEISRYLTYNEYLEVVKNEALDPQGRVIFVLIWNGIRGKEYEDIRNIKEEDVSVVNRTIKVRDKIYTFTEDEMKVISGAMQSYEYSTFNCNGELIKSKSIDSDNKFLAKKAISKINRVDDPISEVLLKIRIKDIADQIGKNMTGLSIEISSRAWHILDTINYNFDMNYTDILKTGKEIGHTLAEHNIGRVLAIFKKKYAEEQK